MVIGGSSSTFWEVLVHIWSKFVDLIGVNVHINPEKDEKRALWQFYKYFYMCILNVQILTRCLSWEKFVSSVASGKSIIKKCLQLRYFVQKLKIRDSEHCNTLLSIFEFWLKYPYFRILLAFEEIGFSQHDWSLFFQKGTQVRLFVFFH